MWVMEMDTTLRRQTYYECRMMQESCHGCANRDILSSHRILPLEQINEMLVGTDNVADSLLR